MIKQKITALFAFWVCASAVLAQTVPNAISDQLPFTEIAAEDLFLMQDVSDNTTALSGTYHQLTWAELQTILFADVTLVNGNQPATPAAGQVRLFSRQDRKMYYINDLGVITEVGGSVGGAATFLDLTDVPYSDYVGHGYKLVQVDQNETALSISNVLTGIVIDAKVNTIQNLGDQDYIIRDDLDENVGFFSHVPLSGVLADVSAAYLSTSDALVLAFAPSGGYMSGNGAFLAGANGVIVAGAAVAVPSLASGTTEKQVYVTSEGILYTVEPPEPGWEETDTDTTVSPVYDLGNGDTPQPWVKLTGLEIVVPEEVIFGDRIDVLTTVSVQNKTINRTGIVAVGFGVNGAEPDNSVTASISPSFDGLIAVSSFSVTKALAVSDTVTAWARIESADNSLFGVIASGDHSLIVSTPGEAGAPGGGADAFLDLTDVPYANYTSHANSLVRVNSTELTLEFSSLLGSVSDGMEGLHLGNDGVFLTDAGSVLNITGGASPQTRGTIIGLGSLTDATRDGLPGAGALGQLAVSSDSNELLFHNGTSWGSTGGAFVEGDPTLPKDTSVDVAIGAAVVGGAKFSIDGDADQLLFGLQENATQTADWMLVEDSAGADLWTFAADGTMTWETNAVLASGTSNMLIANNGSFLFTRAGASKLTLGNTEATFATSIVPTTDGSPSVGSTGKRWNSLFIDDLIEMSEQAVPGNAPADRLHLYTADDTGTTKFYAIDSAGTITDFMDAGGGGASAWVDLSDTPAALTGSGGQSVRVNIAEDSLEFYNPVAGVTSFLDLTDVDPISFNGFAGFFVTVNEGADALEFTNSIDTMTIGSLSFEGAVEDAFEQVLEAEEPLVDGTTTLPNGDYTVVGDTLTQTLTNKTIDAASNTLVGVGDVVGPASSTSTHLAAFSGPSGKLLINSGVPFGDLYTTASYPLTIEDPTDTDDISFFYTPVAITVVELVTVVRGTTPSVTPDIRHGTDRSGAGAALITAPAAVTSVTTGSVISSFDDATIPANSFVWVEFDAVTGTVDEAFLSLEYTED